MERRSDREGRKVNLAMFTLVHPAIHNGISFPFRAFPPSSLDQLLKAPFSREPVEALMSSCPVSFSGQQNQFGRAGLTEESV